MARSIKAGGAALLLAVAGACAAHAQSASNTASQFSRGYAANAGDLSNPVNVSTRDANGNRVILDGVIQNGSNTSMFGKLNVNGALDQF
ncbi:holdfast anchoring protein HfaA, partial [Mycobacterium tuberculosis]